MRQDILAVPSQDAAALSNADFHDACLALGSWFGTFTFGFARSGGTVTIFAGDEEGDRFVGTKMDPLAVETAEWAEKYITRAAQQRRDGSDVAERVPTMTRCGCVECKGARSAGEREFLASQGGRYFTLGANNGYGFTDDPGQAALFTDAHGFSPTIRRSWVK